jgi:hypothetical protein
MTQKYVLFTLLFFFLNRLFDFPSLGMAINLLNILTLMTMKLIVMFLLVSLRSSSERALGLLLVSVLMLMVEWDVNIFWDCTT